jgi:hypothetical protein
MDISRNHTLIKRNNMSLLDITDLEKWEDIPEFIPDALPVSILDVERMPPMNMNHHMSDPCPSCKGFRMLVGDYVCWGFCGACYDDAIQHDGNHSN